jgi:hypothetical protein
VRKRRPARTIADGAEVISDFRALGDRESCSVRIRLKRLEDPRLGGYGDCGTGREGRFSCELGSEAKAAVIKIRRGNRSADSACRGHRHVDNDAPPAAFRASDRTKPLRCLISCRR